MSPEGSNGVAVGLWMLFGKQSQRIRINGDGPQQNVAFARLEHERICSLRLHTDGEGKLGHGDHA